MRRAPTSFADVFRDRVRRRGTQRAFTFLRDGESEGEVLTYTELDRRVRGIASDLDARGCRQERILLLYPPGLEFVTAFLGCLSAGAIAVPAYPPKRNAHLERLETIAADAKPRLVMTTSSMLRGIESWQARSSELEGVEIVATDAVPETSNPPFTGSEIRGDSLAFLQYTSGSTADPRGVEVTHANLVANEAAIQSAFETSADSVIVSWLPFYHDMGLIGGLLQPLYVGAHCVLMSPMAFLQKPVRWLRAISDYAATVSGGPNFAYDLCLRKIDDEEREGLDLSSWRVAFNGAEPVRASTLKAFSAAFADVGFRPEAHYPCYGLAEATLFVTGGSVDAPAAVETVSAAALQQDLVEPAAAGEAAQELVACGRPADGHEVLIADPRSGKRLLSGEIGEIWVRGPSVARGYRNRTEITAETFDATPADGPREGGFLRTGDLGFLRGDELFVTGRAKDLVILRGRNYYPQDIERVVEEAHPALRPGCGAAFAVAGDGQEELVVTYEVSRAGARQVEEVVAAVRRALSDSLDVVARDVVLLHMGSVPRTSSGKIRRHACRQGYLSASLRVVGESPRRRPEPDAGKTLPPPGRAELASLEPAARQEAVERFLCREVARLSRLPVTAVDPAATPAALGLDSLAAVELKQSLEESLEVELALSTLFEVASLTELSRAVLDAKPAMRPSVAEPAPQAGEDLPLSHGQQALWFLHRLNPQSAAYHIAAAARIDGLCGDTFRRAVAALVRRHPALRTTMNDVEGEPRQRVHAELPAELHEEDARPWSEEQLLERMKQEAARPFDLESGPLVRAVLFRRQRGVHALLLVVHHIVSDFTSLAVMARDLGTLYDLESGTATEVPEPSPLAFAAAPREEDLAYWRRRLEGAPFELSLPTDRPRPPVQTYDGAARHTWLAPELSEALSALSRRQGTTLYAVLLAVFQTLLRRYTGMTDFLVGSPAAGRTSAELATAVGYFVNPLALRADVSGDPSWEEFLGRTWRTLLAAFEHQGYPFVLLAEHLQPQRDPSRSPLFQTLFVWHRASRSAEKALAAFALKLSGARLELGGLKLESMALEETSAPLDLVLRMGDPGERLAVSIQYNTDLFDAVTVRRMLGHFGRLLEAVAEAPGRRLSELVLLDAAQTAQILTEWNDTATDPPRLCLHELFELQARRTPDAVALVDGATRLTYRELERRSARLARRLGRLQVGPEVVVALLSERRADLIVGMLGILRAGGAYLPLDPAYPAERLTYTLEDSRAALVLTSRHLEERLPDAVRRLFLAEDGVAEDGAGTHPTARAAADNLAYVIYTSGSTGRPKGVALTHRNAVALVDWALGAYAPEELAGVLAATSVCFDLSIFEIFAPLSVGGRVILAQNALELPALAAAGEVTLVNTVPSAITELVAQGPLPASVRVVNLAGEPLRGALVRQVETRGGVGKVVNAYGPSEDTTYSTFSVIRRGGHGEPTIGRPLSNTRAYLLDVSGRPVPVGVVGEIHLGGAGVTRGYLNRPRLSAERYLPDAFAGRPGARLYRTGDLGRYQTDGEIRFLGRFDHQVKIRGFRIELGEIESALRGHPGVAAVAVVVSDEVPGDLQLVAFYAARGETAPQGGELRRFLRDRLPGYMVPAFYAALDELPLTPSGKIDRRALVAARRAAALHPAQGEGVTAKLQPAEEIVAALWTDLLGKAPADPSDDFFDLGGHSLLATRLASRLSRQTGVEIPVQKIFEHPTLGAQAQNFTRRGAAPAAPALLVADRGEGPLPLSFAQQRVWLLERMSPGNPAYNMPIALELSGRLDLDALRRALARIVARHESLRTRFIVFRGQPAQVVDEPWSPEPEHRDLRTLALEKRRPEALAAARVEARRPFDLERGPLARATLFTLSDQEHVLLWVMHHVVGDGWSLGVFLQELTELYAADLEGRETRLDEPEIQYADFALWQREQLAGQALAEELRYWERQLADSPLLLLPTDRPRPEAPASEGRTLRLEVPAELHQQLETLGRERDATLFMVFLAAFNMLLGHELETDDVVVGTDVANRGQLAVEPLIGFFVNQLVLRTKLSGDPSFAALVDRVREVALSAYAHQNLPFERLFEALKLKRSLKLAPLFQMKLIMNSLPWRRCELPGVSVNLLELETGTSKMDLVVEVLESPGEVLLRFNYNTDLFETSTIERLMDGFQAILDNVSRRSEIRLSELREIVAKQMRTKRMENRKPRKSFDKFKKSRPKAVNTTPRELVETHYLAPDMKLPLVFQPTSDDVVLAEWAADNRSRIEQELERHGALLFRGFQVDSAENFESFAKAVCSELFQENGEHPRESVDGNVYTPVFFPPDQKLLWHNENSFNLRWPAKIIFCCIRPADEGGETPIVDSREIFNKMRPEIRQKFVERGVGYMRNYRGGLGLDWRNVFQTSERAEAERYCRENEMEIEWKDGGERVRTFARRPAVGRHPRTGEMSWFNQAQHFHVACLQKDLRDSLTALYSEDDLPRHCFYGDGSPIPDEVMQEVMKIYEEHEISFPWQKNDIMLLDNMLVAHARNPFRGERKLLVSMGEMMDSRELLTS